MKQKRLILGILGFLAMSCLCSCGASRTSVKVRNNADGTTTTIDVKNGDGGATEVKVAPKVQLDSINFKIH